jgi:type I restriction enzyme S subunit
VQTGDVIFATVRPTLKRVALVAHNLDGQVVSTAFCVLRANPLKADAGFIFYSLLTDDFINRVGNLERGASYPAVTDNDVLGQEIVVPPLPEQRAIAAVLSKIQTAAEVQEKIVTALKEVKAATMARLFREGLRGEPLKQTEIGEIPESWTMKTIASLGDLVTGTTPPTKNPDHYGGQVPFISPADISDGRIVRKAGKSLSQSGVAVSRPLPPNSVLVVCIGSTIGKVGMTWAPMSCTNQQINAIVCKKGFVPEFVHYLMVWNSDRIRNLSTPSPVPILSKGAFGEAIVALPVDQQEQSDIARVLCAIDDRIEIAESCRNGLKGLFSSMLHLLMTGQVRVTQKMIALQAAEEREKKRRRYTGKMDDKVVQKIVQRIVEAVEPEKIILFGSAARGEMGPDSDLDLLVIKSCENKREVAREIRQNLIRIGIPTDVVVVTPEDVEYCKDIPGYIIRPALKEGKVVYAA